MYCLKCGSPANHSIPQGDQRPRLVCLSCQYIHYENPKMVCGVLALHQGKILLCRRAIEPRYGYWTLPAGFLEVGESMRDGAVRETLEEADATAINTKLFALFDLPHLGQIHAMYLANVKDGKFGVGAESLECRLFGCDEIPWQALSFRTVELTLRYFLSELKTKSWQNFDAFALFETVLDDKQA